MEAISLVARLRAFIIDRIKIKGILFPILLAFAFSASGETPLISDNSATVTDSGTRGICVLCSVSDVNHLVENSMQLNATFSLPVGVLGSAYEIGRASCRERVWIRGVGVAWKTTTKERRRV